MRTVPIGELVGTVSSWNPSTKPGVAFTYVDLSAVDNGSKAIIRPVVVTGADAPSRARQLVGAGDVLVSTVRPNLNAVAVVPEALDGATASTGFTVLRPGRHLDSRFLFHWVRCPAFIDDMVRKATGASYPAISDRIVKESPVPLPPLPEQRRIAAILDHADALRAKRRQVLAHLDALTQSIFDDMFGNPMANDRSLPLAKIGEIAPVVTGNSPSRLESSNFGDNIEWIKSDNLGGPIASKAEEWLSEYGRARARTAPPGSILVTCIAGSPTSIGKASMVAREVAFNQQINAVLPSPLVDSSFLLGQLKTAPELVRSKSTGGMKGLVSKSSFQSIEVLAPPLAAQREFSARLAAVAKRQVGAQSAMAFDDELFASLQARAFSGRL